LYFALVANKASLYYAKRDLAVVEASVRLFVTLRLHQNKAS